MSGTINPLKLLEKEYSLIILQYLHLNPYGRTFEQIVTSIDHNASPIKVRLRLNEMLDLGLICQEGEESDILYALTSRGRSASEVVWDLFRIILNPRDEDDDRRDILDFYR